MKEEILDKIIPDASDNFDANYRNEVLEAMQEYSDQQNKELKEIVIQLQKDFVLKLEDVKKQECIALIDFIYFNWSVIEDMSERQVYEFFIQSKQ